MKEIGTWMKVNDEAIYSTRPLAPYRSGKLGYTRHRDGTAYAIYLADPDEKLPPQILLTSIVPAQNARMVLLGAAENLKWEKRGNEVAVLIPETLQKNPPCEHAWVIKISALEK